jgi:hypothetical protein
MPGRKEFVDVYVRQAFGGRDDIQRMLTGE